jgi:hypothetical protein
MPQLVSMAANDSGPHADLRREAMGVREGQEAPDAKAELVEQGRRNWTPRSVAAGVRLSGPGVRHSLL